MFISVFGHSRCPTRVRVFVIFYNGDDRNDRNDTETEKSPVRTIARGLKTLSFLSFVSQGNLVSVDVFGEAGLAIKYSRKAYSSGKFQPSVK